ncbi:peptide chain release factor N(5)-glutamine methyltransferase [Clostridium botulinum C]|uniref:Release factor glutamine methyltransferase n=2 Tax=Clostridium botulinum TaxID=1491 RepID=A0A9Q4XT73_CLOBO|nr:peptide chain release factor N(5)-glutamine methyltransferase [Clostridium botulinum]EGO89027.2 SAM-dependent methyltransferase [Clostridium botulinum C str. Stockholm]MCD3194969.1 peptide chain release factor N(5)-glutamine methyltransferase [Clostridium botulinum C]MCD3200768.1 peptide chain release factor N(5)-glutamine methyltransferase [Clostridium botulinum C]MCD3206176.1 peptide chain release factor N(5)-glutamine methyltransferase [Clostridium botulinum C]MCD3208374.1 peptide chain 
MTIGEALSIAYNTLKVENIDTYILDSQLLMQKVLKKDKLFIILNRNLEISLKDQEEFFKLIKLRKDKMPVKYILGECEFMGLNFNVKEGVLIPRADTEVLVEEVIKEIKENGYNNVCDVCCGSGAIGISIGKYIKETIIDCYDISDIAIEVTKNNINKFQLNNKVYVYKSDLLDEAKRQNKMYDVIVSNPPYIKEEVIPTLMKDVKEYEPYIALCGGKDGLYFYNKITKNSVDFLNRGGLLAFEIGYDQGKEVKDILIENRFSNIKVIKDLAGLDRVVMGRL